MAMKSSKNTYYAAKVTRRGARRKAIFATLDEKGKLWKKGKDGKRRKANGRSKS